VHCELAPNFLTEDVLAVLDLETDQVLAWLGWGFEFDTGIEDVVWLDLLLDWLALNLDLFVARDTVQSAALCDCHSASVFEVESLLDFL